MNNNHISASDVSAYRADTTTFRSIEIGRHLLVCKECRAKLPSVSPNEFRACLANSNDLYLVSDDAHKPAFLSFPKFTTLSRVVSFATLAIVLVGGIYFARLNRTTEDTRSIAKNETAPGASNTESGFPNPPKADPNRSKIITPANNTNERDISKRVITGPAPKRPGNSERQATSRTTETRGTENPCSSGAVLNLESGASSNEIFLKWDAVKSADSYEVFISDLDENLLDHFQSKTQNFYQKTMTLDEGKTYRWKLIITLKNGSRIVGPAQDLKASSIEDQTRPGGNSRKERASFEVRCIAGK